MAKVRVELNHASVRSILTGGAVLADLRARAERIALAAGAGFEVDSQIGRNRARASVRTATFEARHRQARNHTLTAAIDAGR